MSFIRTQVTRHRRHRFRPFNLDAREMDGRMAGSDRQPFRRFRSTDASLMEHYHKGTTAHDTASSERVSFTGREGGFYFLSRLYLLFARWLSLRLLSSSSTDFFPNCWGVSSNEGRRMALLVSYRSDERGTSFFADGNY